MSTILDWDTANLRIAIHGMRCAGCVSAIERELRDTGQFAGISVDLVTEQAIIAFDPHLSRTEVAQQALAAIARAGFQGRIADTATETERHPWQSIQPMVYCALLLLLGMGGHSWHWEHHWTGFYWTGATALLLVAGWEVWRDGIQAFYRSAPNMNSLVTLGSLGSYTSSAIAVLQPKWGWHSYLSEVLFLLGFVLLGQIILNWAKASTAKEITALLKRQPQIAHKITPEGTVDIPAIAVQKGDRLLVKAGEAIPTDGIVLEGATTVDEAMITGEAMPVPKTQGDQVYGATLNLTSRLVITASHLPSETLWSKIVSLVQQAQLSKAPIHHLVDVVSAYFVWGVILVAVITCLTWCHLVPSVHDMLFGIQMGIAVLVVACPCALGLAMPTAIAVGLGLGAKHGILIKSAAVLEIIPKINAVVFDKTGTLTQGKPQVTDIVPYGNCTAEELLLWSASAESAEGHPWAQAIVQAALDRQMALIPIQHSQNYPGAGIAVQLANQHSLRLGTEAWLQQWVAIPPAHRQLAEQFAQQGKTPVFVARAETYGGLLALRDQPKPQARQVVAQLHSMGLQVYLLTGDRQTTAHAIAKELGIAPERVIAEVKPTDKAQTVKDLQQQGYRVAMVGDGINDAPALATADVGIAMGSGMDVAIATADIVLLGRQKDLEGVPRSLQLGKATFSKIYQNLYWAFAYNTLSLPIAAGVFSFAGITLTPAIAALAMAGSSISVVLNSLSLKLHSVLIE
jgi:Cu2+-exporting ATPase